MSPAGTPAPDPVSRPASAAGLTTEAEWLALLSAYPAIVLVANSDAVDLDALRQTLPAETLFVFFNKVYKVLDRPFEGRALLVARSSPAGANIVYRREVADVLRFFPGDAFLGILNLKCGPKERFSGASDFAGAPAGHLNLAGRFADFYPDDHVPSSGFALAAWLCEQALPARIVLAGFSARRSTRWKLFHDHDWTLEQVVQRVLVRAGRLELAGEQRSVSMAAIAGRFPGITQADVSVAAAEVLSERLEGANREIDGLISATRAQRALHALFRRLKPKTRKQRQAEPGKGGGAAP